MGPTVVTVQDWMGNIIVGLMYGRGSEAYKYLVPNSGKKKKKKIGHQYQ